MSGNPEDYTPSLKTYLAIDQVMNGTVTMQTVISGIRATSFKEAVQQFKSKCKEKVSLQITQESNDTFTYTIIQEQNSYLSVCGHIQYEPLKML